MSVFLLDIKHKFHINLFTVSQKVLKFGDTGHYYYLFNGCVYCCKTSRTVGFSFKTEIQNILFVTD